MRRVIVFFSVFCMFLGVYGQRKNKMYYTEIPMNITTQLDSVYYICTKFSGVGAGINVHNLANYKKTSWDDGVYVFCGMGPHFQPLLFIHYNKKIYVLSSHCITNVLKQLVDARDKLKIKGDDYIQYVKLVVDYVINSYKLKGYYSELEGEDELESYGQIID